ncbi:MAG TPA: helix-turn-helix domain-containing protein [Anaerolineaceae bacterium]|nr:helix-turn-helix domain-containing protein [Anaerolineaceae bacterium]
MPQPLKIELTEHQRQELEAIRDHHELPYLRERAAAILKIADGHSGLQTARNLLNRAHWQDTIYDWVKRYQAEGVEGLKIRSGRGRKPAFFPSTGHRAGRPRSD